jgi:predicted nucleic acid-binding Zn ribbon protein
MDRFRLPTFFLLRPLVGPRRVLSKQKECTNRCQNPFESTRERSRFTHVAVFGGFFVYFLGRLGILLE